MFKICIFLCEKIQIISNSEKIVDTEIGLNGACLSSRVGELILGGLSWG